MSVPPRVRDPVLIAKPLAPNERSPADLTARRREILELIAKGLTNDEIARVLRLSPGTVRVQVSNILADLEVTNRTEATALYLAWKARAESVDEVFARPAIAVFPLTARSDEPSAERAAAAFGDELARLFARWSWFAVVRGDTPSADDARGEVGALDVRYAVRGSVQTDGDLWRVRVQLEDVREGSVLWAERYDTPASAVFALQDSLCERVVATAYEVLERGISQRVPAVRHPGSVSAWTLAHHGMREHTSRNLSRNAAARGCFVEALAGDPGLVLAHYGLGLCHYDAILNQLPGASPKELFASAGRCVELAPHAAEGYFLLGRHSQVKGRHEDAVAPLETAIARNPSFAHAHALLAQVLVLVGRPDEGLARMRHAQRLSPRAFVTGLATLHFLREEYELALEHCERAIASYPTYPFGFALAASSAYWLGRRAAADGFVRALRSLQPHYSPARFLLTFGPDFSGVDRIARALAEMGIAR